MLTSKSVIIPLVLSLLLLPLLANASTVDNNIIQPGQVIQLKKFNGKITGLSWSKDGKYIAVLLDPPQLTVLALNGTVIKTYPLSSTPGKVEWRPGHDFIAVSAGDEVLVYHVVNGQTYEEIAGSKVSSIAWSFDGSRLAAGTVNCNIIVLGFYTDGRPIYRFSVILHNVNITALAFTHNKNIILIGDDKGYVRLYNLALEKEISKIQLTNQKIVDIAVNPLNNLIAVLTNNESFIGELSGTVIKIYEKIPYGGASDIAWSPDGSEIIIPWRGLGVVVTLNGTIIKIINPPIANYSINYASWNPAKYYELALSAYKSIGHSSILALLYSGALVSVTTSPPVAEVCLSGICGKNITLSPKTSKVNITLILHAYTLKRQECNIAVNLSLKLKPFKVINIDIKKFLVKNNSKLHAERGKGIIYVLHDSSASLYVKYNNSWIKMQGGPIVVDPGVYHLSLRLNKPDNYLGPDSILVKNITLNIDNGMVVVLNYTWFKLDSLTATLQVFSEPGSILYLKLSQETVTTKINSQSAEYTIPAGTYSIEIQLPSENALVPSTKVLISKQLLKVNPKDKILLSFHYDDITGELILQGPVGSLFEVTPPWSTDLNPVKYNIKLEKSRIIYKAYPGTYKIKIKPPVPLNFLGPRPPIGYVNVTVVKGETTIVDAYSIKEISSYLQLVSSSANVTILANKGYIIVIRTGNETYRFNTTRNLTLLIPPGTYKIDLVKPGKNLLIVNSKKIVVTGPGKITVNLIINTEKSSTTKPTGPVYTPEESGKDKKRMAAIGSIIVIIFIAIALVIKSRRGGEELTL